MSPLKLRPTTRLLDHQRTGVDWLLHHERSVLADAPGLGKTLTALALVHVLGDQAFPLLIVTEAAVVSQWVLEVETKTTGITTVTCYDKDWRRGQPSSVRGPLVISSYGMLKTRSPGAFQGPYGLVVLDEASSFKSHGTGAFDAVRQVTGKADRAVALTATPVENDCVETYNILDGVRTPGLWPRGEFYQDFIEWGHHEDRRFALPGINPRREVDYRGYLRGAMLRRSAAQAGLKLPMRVGQIDPWWVTPSNQEVSAYRRARRRDDLGGVMLRQTAGRTAGGSSSLVDELLRILGQRPGDEQVIVYCETLDVLDQAEARLTAARVSFERLDGSVTDEARDHALARHRKDPTVRVLLGSTVLERGLNLQHARLLISLDTSFNPAREAQREGRICRIGSPHDTYEHIVLVSDTDDNRRKVDTLGKKAAQVELLPSPEPRMASPN